MCWLARNRGRGASSSVGSALLGHHLLDRAYHLAHGVELERVCIARIVGNVDIKALFDREDKFDDVEGIEAEVR